MTSYNIWYVRGNHKRGQRKFGTILALSVVNSIFSVAMISKKIRNTSSRLAKIIKPAWRRLWVENPFRYKMRICLRTVDFPDSPAPNYYTHQQSLARWSDFITQQKYLDDFPGIFLFGSQCFIGLRISSQKGSARKVFCSPRTDKTEKFRPRIYWNRWLQVWVRRGL